MKHEAIRPNLFVIGAMKCGTTTLHELLRMHPRIYMTPAKQKEPGFFVPEIWGNRSRMEYLDLFACGMGAAFRGESSTHYSKYPKYAGVPERIQQFSPDARIIYVVRNPIERTVSHYWHAVNARDETRPFKQAIRENPDYIDFSRYRMQYMEYAKVFQQGRIMVLQFEALTKDPKGQLDRIARWLGLDPFPEDLDYNRQENMRPSRVELPRGQGLLWRVRWSRAYDRFSQTVPRWVKRVGARLAYATIDPRKDWEMPAACTEWLAEIFMPDLEWLRAEMGIRYASA